MQAVINRSLDVRSLKAGCQIDCEHVTHSFNAEHKNTVKQAQRLYLIQARHAAQTLTYLFLGWLLLCSHGLFQAEYMVACGSCLLHGPIHVRTYVSKIHFCKNTWWRVAPASCMDPYMSERTCQNHTFARIHGGVWFLPPALTHTRKNVRVKKMLARIHGGVWLLLPAWTHTCKNVCVKKCLQEYMVACGSCLLHGPIHVRAYVSKIHFCKNSWWRVVPASCMDPYM
jgi:hypothetical protein